MKLCVEVYETNEAASESFDLLCADPIPSVRSELHHNTILSWAPKSKESRVAITYPESHKLEVICVPN